MCSGRYWETVQRLGITQFYGAPTALRLLLKYDESWVKKYDRSSLRTLGSGQTDRSYRKLSVSVDDKKLMVPTFQLKE